MSICSFVYTQKEIIVDLVHMLHFLFCNVNITPEIFSLSVHLEYTLGSRPGTVNAACTTSSSSDISGAPWLIQ